MNEQLEQFEEQLNEMDYTKKIAIYVVIFISIVYMSWNFFGEDMNQNIEDLQENILTLEKKLQKNNIKTLERAIAKAKKEKLVLDDRLTTLRFQNEFIKNKLEDIDFIYYDQLGVVTILDNILENSIKNKIDLSLVESQDINKIFTQYIMEKKLINIKGIGSFKHIINLMQYIDNLNGLIRVKDFIIDIDEVTNNTRFEITISEFGVEL